METKPLHATDDLLLRARGEFSEMPGLRLTEPQAQRLWGLDAASCRALLSALVDSQFLFRTRDGAFMRVEHRSSDNGSAGKRDGCGVTYSLDDRLSSTSPCQHPPHRPGGRPFRSPPGARPPQKGRTLAEPRTTTGPTVGSALALSSRDMNARETFKGG